ncbi:MAG: hypothetical protein QM726_08950 [Chitinophagaceae bacterium]
MIDTIVLKDLKAVYEDAAIQIAVLKAEKLSDVLSETYMGEMPPIDIHHELSIMNNGEKKIIEGNLIAGFSNMNKDKRTAIMLTTQFSCTDAISSSAGDLLHKFLLYLYNWLKQYINEQQLLDNDGKLIALADFSFPQNYFNKQLAKADKKANRKSGMDK